MYTALLAMMAALVPAGCGEERHGAGGGTVVVGGYVDIRTMNPFVSLGDVNQQLQRFLLFTPLLALDEELRYVPRLAERWDTVRVSADSIDLTMYLRRDVAWHDGTPTTAADVAFTFERALDPRTTWADVAAFTGYRPTAEVADSHTVRFRLAPRPEFLEGFVLLPPLPRHLLGDVPPAELRTHPFGVSPTGNGPFRFVRRLDSDWTFEANADFPEPLGGRPRVDRFVYRHIPDQTAVNTELLTGSIDLSTAVLPSQTRELAAQPGIRVIEYPLAKWTFITLNTRLPFFDTREERRALSMAIDRATLVQVVQAGHATPGRGTVTPLHPAFAGDDSATVIPYDTAAARRTLAGAGWIDRDGDGVLEDVAGNEFRFELKAWQGTAVYREIAEIVQAQLREVGIVAEPRIVELNTFIAQLQGTPDEQGVRRRDFDAAVSNWIDNLRKDDAPQLHSRFLEAPHHATGFTSPRLDALLDSLAATTNADVSGRLWGEYQRLMVAESPYIVLFYPMGLAAVRDRLHGVVMDARGLLATVTEWWIEEESDGE